MVASMAAAGRSAAPLIRTLYTKTTPTPSSLLRFSISPSSSSTPSPFVFFLGRTRISPPSLRLRRELSSLLPVHSAIASASLVSRLPHGPSTSAECRFANYVSPI